MDFSPLNSCLPAFIVFEGIDGAGKTTLSKEIYETLKFSFPKVVWTREPFNDSFKELLLNKDLDPWSETFLFLADRREHVTKYIKPKLEEGFTVICDRFYLSTLAYQGYGRNLNLKKLEELNRLVINGVKPTITFLLDIPVDIALKRLKKSRGKLINHFEKKEFLEKVRKGFLKLASKNSRIIVLRATEPLEILKEKVLNTLEEIFSVEIPRI
jgi:dTMP kinase